MNDKYVSQFPDGGAIKNSVDETVSDSYLCREFLDASAADAVTVGLRRQAWLIGCTSLFRAGRRLGRVRGRGISSNIMIIDGEYRGIILYPQAVFAAAEGTSRTIAPTVRKYPF